MEARLPEVRVGERGENIDAFLERAREILLPALGRDVVISSYTQLHKVVPPEDGNFHVYLWASISGNHNAGNRNRRSVLFGLSMGSQEWNWHGPSEQSRVFFAPENNAAVAELMGDNLYIFVPINDERLAHVGPDIFSCILQMVVESGALGTPVSLEERAAMIRGIQKGLFVKLCGSRMAHNIQVTEAAIRDKDARLEKQRTQLLNGYLQLKASREKLSRPAAPIEGEKFGNEFDGLLRVPKVHRVVVVDYRVEVYTDTIYCRDPRTKILHELGKFRICVDVFGGDVKWFNLTRRINGHKKNMHAPHVFDEGEACLGSAAETLAELLSNFEISATVMYAIQFLESVNVDDDSGRHVDRWPTAANQSAA